MGPGGRDVRLLSLDETASIHELLGLVFSARMGDIAGISGLYTWVVLLAPIGLVAALIMGRWLPRKAGPRSGDRSLIIAALTMWMLVPAVELLDPINGQARHLIVLEESLELIDMALMLAAFLQLRSRLASCSGGDAVANSVLDSLAESI